MDVIISSKLKRARETAQIVAEYHPEADFMVKSLIKEEENLAEISWGDWEGSSSPMLPGLLANWSQGDYHANAPNGESPNQVELRAVPAIYDIIMSRPENVFLFVCKCN